MGSARTGRRISRSSNAVLSLNFAEIADLHRIKTARYATLIAAGGCPLRPGVRKFLRKARRRRAAAGDRNHDVAWQHRRAALGRDWADLFETIVAGDDVPRKKPAPDVYIETLARLGLAPADCIAVEDSGNGLIAASEAGVPVIITRSAYFGEDDFAGALLVVDDLSEIDD